MSGFSYGVCLLISKCGFIFRQSVFVYGQLYVTLSIVKIRNRLKILILDDDVIFSNKTSNVCYDSSQ